MRVLFKLTLFVMVSVIFCSCIKQVDVPLRNEQPILVVEGSITTDSVPYTVKLTYSGPLAYATDIPDQYLEQNASVSISDDLGNSTVLSYTGSQGIYQTTDVNYVGIPGRSYQVTIDLPGGKRYISKPEKLPEPVPVDRVNISFNSEFDILLPSSLHVFVDTKDPGLEENYYKWDFTSYFLRKTRGIGCGFGCVMFEYCFQRWDEEKIRILSDDAINGNNIVNQEVGKSYIYTYGKHYVDIRQQSLTREAYQFWQLYNEQLTRTGSTLDPLPAAIKGNVFNSTNTDDIALGYFSAVGVTHRKLVLIPFSISEYLLQISALQHVPEGANICFEFFPNTLPYPPPPAPQYPPPPGWENAESLEVRWQYP